MNIRHLRDETDVRGVQRVNRRAWRAAYDFLPDDLLDARAGPPSDDEVADYFDRVRDDRDRFLVAERDGKIVGYAYVRWDDTKAFVGDDEAGLKEIYVDPDHWSEGVGTALLDSAIDLLPDDVTALALEAFAGNDLAARFYAARGFERVDSGEVDIGGDTYETEIRRREL
jgi:ribosomal protein S18 acetylase RimI-like enzyme